jgi:PAS domain S-box-containing protein
MTAHNNLKNNMPDYNDPQQIVRFINNSTHCAHLYELHDNLLIFRSANDAADKIFGINHEELIGLSIESAFPGLAITHVPAILKDVAKNGISWKSEEFPYQDNNVTRFFKVTAFQISPGSVIAMFVDFSEHKNTELALKHKNEVLLAIEAELRERNEKLVSLNEILQKQNEQLGETYKLLSDSEERFKIAFKTSPDAVNLNRLSDGMYIQVNDGFTQLTGYTWDDVKYRPSAEMNIWADPDDRDKLVEQLKLHGKVQNAEALFRLKNGELRHGLMSASIIHIQNDDYILSVTRDVEEIVQARAQIRESESRFRQLADSIEDTFWLVEGHRLIYVNESAEKTLGLNLETLYNNPVIVKDFVHPDDLDIFMKLGEFNNTQHKEPLSCQFRLIGPDGKVKWTWVRLFSIFNNDNKVSRVAGIASDITHQKQIEDELRNAKEKAQESDLLKSAFLANLSHEIRTPMNGIIGFTSLLLNENLDASLKKKYSEIIKKSSNQLLNIIDDLVDISKIEANQLKIIRQECNVRLLLEELHIIFSQQLQAFQKTSVSLKLQCDLADANAVIITDEYRLRQVLMNLLNNAVKFTDQGHIVFGIMKEDPEFLKFFVEDTGIGIEQNMFEDIFKPFIQLDIRASKEYSGTGLGLSISRGLVNLLGGQIWLKSEPGKGTTFSFTLPVNTPVLFESKPEAIDVRLDFQAWNGQTILCAEDDDVSYKYLEEILKPTGLILERAITGTEAVEKAKEFNPILIILDIRLPLLNGFDVSRQIRESGNNVPIIAQTAYALREDRNECLEAGCNDYIPKPIPKNDLLRSILNQLRSKSRTILNEKSTIL